jgi:hypothetical protein
MVLTTFDDYFGLSVASHVAVEVSNGRGDQVLYDPAGSYRAGTRGSGDAFYGDEVDLKRYMAHHESVGSQVRRQAFALSSTDADRIIERIEGASATSPFYCTCSILDTLDGVGPFRGLRREVGRWATPGRLYEVLDARLREPRR